MSARDEPVDGISYRDSSQGDGDGVEEGFADSSLDLLQERFNLRPHLFDEVEVRTVGRQEW